MEEFNFTEKAEQAMSHTTVCMNYPPKNLYRGDKITLKFEPSDQTIQFECIDRHLDLSRAEPVCIYTLDFVE